MIVIQESTKARLTLDISKEIGGGGEGKIFPVANQDDIVAKVYHQQKGSCDKLIQMIQSPPIDPTSQQGHISICWPIDVIKEETGPAFGYLMPRAAMSTRIVNVYTSSSRIKDFSEFNYQYLIRSGLNLARTVNSIHKSGYVIGDINESNVLVNPKALIAIVDTDSFQVRAPTQIYHCEVKRPEFLPPELIGAVLGEVDREYCHDNFALAVTLFHLLMEGAHPFKGAYTGAGNPPSLKEKIKEGYFPYSKTRPSPIKPDQFAPPFSILNTELQGLFLRAFDDGHFDPYARPTPQEWSKAFQKAEKDLIVCNANSQHYYPSHLIACPWCERKQFLKGIDPFPEKKPQPRSARGNIKSNVREPLSHSSPPRQNSVTALPKTPSPSARANYRTATPRHTSKQTRKDPSNTTVRNIGVAVLVIALILLAAIPPLREQVWGVARKTKRSVVRIINTSFLTPPPIRKTDLAKGKDPLSSPSPVLPPATSANSEAPARPPRPSKTLRSYAARDGSFKVQVPSNWEVFYNERIPYEVNIFPQGGYVIYNNYALTHDVSYALTHGVRLGIIEPQSKDIISATTALVQQYAKSHRDFRIVKEPQPINFGGKQGYMTTIGRLFSDLTEVDIIYTTSTVDGRLFYIFTNAPEDEQMFYKDTFEQILKSIRLSN